MLPGIVFFAENISRNTTNGNKWKLKKKLTNGDETRTIFRRAENITVVMKNFEL